MKTKKLFSILLVSVVLLGGTSQAAAQKTPPPPSTAEFYPNTADSLHSLLADLLTAAKSDSQEKLSSKIAEMEIPDYENWFTRTYGKEKGPASASAYGKSLKLSEQHFQMLWVELAKGEGEISISKSDAANRKFDFAKRDDTLANPTDEFAAAWKKTDSSPGPAGQTIGYFCFVDGKFRLKSFPYEVHILSTTKLGPAVPAKLINRVPPAYPVLARQAKIQGLVSVNVVIGKDGTVTVQNVGAGHPLLAPAAVAAVQQWKYEPATVGGVPVDVGAKIYVAFDLTKQQGDQKQ